MKSCDMVIVVPVDKHTGNDEVLRLQAWGEVSELLRPGLGKLYRQFNPSGSAWERKYPRPFGVVLGRQSRRCSVSFSKQERKRSMRQSPFIWRQCSARQTLAARRKSAIRRSILRLWTAAIPSCWHMASGIFSCKKALLFRTAAFTMPRCTVHPQPRRKSARSWIMSANTQCAWSR